MLLPLGAGGKGGVPDGENVAAAGGEGDTCRASGLAGKGGRGGGGDTGDAGGIGGGAGRGGLDEVAEWEDGGREL